MSSLLPVQDVLLALVHGRREFERRVEQWRRLHGIEDERGPA